MLAFLGRFHPLAVHVPIGMCLLVGLFELLSISPRLRPRTDPALAIIHRLTLASVIVALGLGLALASEGGHPDRLLRLHRGLALATVLATTVSFVTWSMHVERRVPRLAYRLAVGSTLVLLGAGAHYGGSMTHGEGYLVERAPAFVQRWLGYRAPPLGEATAGASLPADEPRVFDDVVLPVLEQRCAHCHGASTAKGQLRLDDFGALMKGGKSGPAVEIGDARRSLVMRRIAMPLASDGHMPPEGKPQLTSDEVELIGLWIDRGASRATKVRELLVPDGARRLLVDSRKRTTEAVRVEPGTASPPPPATSVPPPPTANRTTSDSAVFHDRIAPILAAKCGRCHGESKQRGNLRTDSLSALLRGGESGPAIVPGAPGRGTLLARVRLPADHDDHMPPQSAPQLEANELRALTQWLSGGAEPSVVAPAKSQPSMTPSASVPLRAALAFDVVEPILVERCGACHSGTRPSGGLSVRDRDALLAKAYVLPGQADASPLLSRMTLAPEDADHMPPMTAPQPSRAELEIVRLWIEGGAGGARVSSPPPPTTTPERHADATTAGEESRMQVRGGCAGCAIGGGDRTERLAFGLGPALLAAVALRRRRRLAR